MVIWRSCSKHCNLTCVIALPMACPKCKYAVLKYYSISFQCEKYVNSGKYKWVGVHMLWNSYAACIPLRINIVDFPQLVPSICSCVLTDLLGNSISLIRRAGHQTRRHRDARFFQQPDAHVFMQGEVPLLLHWQHWRRLVAMITK